MKVTAAQPAELGSWLSSAFHSLVGGGNSQPAQAAQPVQPAQPQTATGDTAAIGDAVAAILHAARGDSVVSTGSQSIYIPRQSLAADAIPQTPDQWIPGVSNGAVMLGMLAVLVLVLRR